MGGSFELRRLSDPKAVSQSGAELFIDLARKAIGERGRFVVALSGGSTPRTMFQLLADAPRRDQVDWKNIEFFWSDERAVPPDLPDSNFHMAREAMLSKLPIPAERIHRMPGEAGDLNAAAREHQSLIAQVFGVDDGEHVRPPAFDLILLGMGPDGHTASLFPHTAALAETDRWVVPNYVPRLNAHRLTFTTRLINEARCVAFLTAGAEKTEPLAQVLQGLPNLSEYPSQRIAPRNGRLIWIVDEVASAKLKSHRGSGALAAKSAPSILAADFAHLGRQVLEAEAAGADRIHVDVMDGHFVPNLSLGPCIVESLRPVTKLPLETHLMVQQPDLFLDEFLKAGSDLLIVHAEGNPNLHRTVQTVRSAGKPVGVAINPATPIGAVDEILPDVDLILVMTVNPGFGGQKFIEQTLGKIARLRGVIDWRRPGCHLEVDGGVDAETGVLCVEAGANVLVAGSSIFRAKEGIAAAVAKLNALRLGPTVGC